jgi:hypothetical protein
MSMEEDDIDEGDYANNASLDADMTHNEQAPQFNQQINRQHEYAKPCGRI